jgi:large subunit ribosomal protein L10
VALAVDVKPREPRAEKVAVVDEVRARLDAANATILTEYRGLTVARMAELRKLLGDAGGEYKVYKNTLVRRAAHENGLDLLDTLLEGPTAVAFVNGDVAAVAKVLRDFARANPALIVKGGLIGSSLLDARSTAQLAELPSREVLLAQLAGALAAPMQRFAGLLAAVPSKFAYGLSALIDSRGGPEVAPVAEVAPAAEAEPVVAPEPATDEAPAEDLATHAPAEAAAAEQAAPAEAAPAAEDAPVEAEATPEEVVVLDAVVDPEATAEDESPTEVATADGADA